MVEKIYTVAVSVNDNGEVDRVLRVMNCNEKRYNELCISETKQKEKESLEKSNLYRTVNVLLEKVEKLEKEIKVLKGEEQDEEVY